MRFLLCILALCTLSWAEDRQYVMIDSDMRDIDKDKEPELMVLYTVSSRSNQNFGLPRELIIYKTAADGALIPWIRSKSAVLDAEAGGIMGDPFMGMSYEYDTLVISHFGGSQIKWSYTDKYRFQDNKMVLVEHISKFFDGGCHFKELVYDLNTGNASYTRNKSLHGDLKNCDQNIKTLNAKGNFPRLQPVSIENRHTFVPYEIMADLERSFYTQ